MSWSKERHAQSQLEKKKKKGENLEKKETSIPSF